MRLRRGLLLQTAGEAEKRFRKRGGHMKKIMVLVIIALVVILGAVLVAAGWQLGAFDKPAAAVAIGAPMPDFTLRDIEGVEHTLSQYRGKTVVLVFASFKCPWSKGADPQIAALAEEYSDRDVVFLAIDSHYDTSPEEIAAYANAARLPFATVKDEGNRYADLVGAKRTPEVFLVDREGALVYHGAFDNRRGTDAPGGKTYTADALAALLEGKSIPVAETRSWGCTIKRAE